jgi:3-oxoacyl-[acyl-carrier-protein] synthase II
MALQEPDGRATWERGFKRLHPFWMLQYLSNNAHALLAADVQALGDGATFAGASGGAQALGAAIRALHAGVIDAAVVVAYGSLAEPETLVELADAAAVSRGGLAALSAPYSGDADGFVPGEAAVALVLERPATAGKRARALVAATDGGDGERGQPRSETFTRVVAGVAVGAEVVDGAARARPTLDCDERVGLATLLPDGTPLMASSAAMGEIGSAKPLAQIIVLAECLRRGVLPPIAGLQAPALGPLRPLTTLVQTRARVAIGIVTGAPGLVGTVRVELP